MDDLYTGILYKTLHFKGHDADVDRLDLLEFLQKAFERDDTTHNHLLEVAKARKVSTEHHSYCISYKTKRNYG
jgi:hypothetical protein